MLGPAKRTSKAPTATVVVASAAADVQTPSPASTSATGSPDNFKGPRPKSCVEHVVERALAGVLPHDLPEWIETYSIDGEVSRLVSTQAGKSRRCCRNSSSSGYSSHSPPLSAASYGIGPTIGTKGLAVIREGEIIPRPIWPSPLDSTGENSPDNASSDAEREGNRQQASLYAGSAGYRSSCEGSNSDYGATSSVSAREVLLELSRTLSSVLEGDCGKTDEEILRDISRTVAQGAIPDTKRRNVYEEIYRNTSLSSSGKESTSTIAVNPINSRLYGHRCYCERKSFLCQSHPSSSQRTSPKSDGRKEQCAPSVFLLPDAHTKSLFPQNERNWTNCNCKNYKNTCNVGQDKLSSKKNLGKQSRSNQNDTRADKDIRFNYPSIVEHEYTTLECSDESSSSEGVTDASVGGNTWCKDFRGFDKNLDFTLDGLRAERLGRAIARAKRRRQWCRVLVVIIGLIFFVLSVVVVSLSVTRGRKVFGSM